MKCQDARCPKHGKISLHGRTFKAVVVSTKMQKTVIVKWKRQHYLPKYERFETRFTKIKVHKPECMDVKERDVVLIQETKPLSKTKHFVITKILKNNT